MIPPTPQRLTYLQNFLQWFTHGKGLPRGQRKQALDVCTDVLARCQNGPWSKDPNPPDPARQQGESDGSFTPTQWENAREALDALRALEAAEDAVEDAELKLRRSL
jgi:hypothetical protein